MKARRISVRSAVAAAGGLAIGAVLAPVLPATAQTPLPAAVFSGYSTGTVLHTGALTSGTTQLANVEQAFSGSSVASQGTGTLPPQGPGAGAGQIVNDMGQVVQPTLPAGGKLSGNRSYARGSGLEVGLGQNLPAGSPTIPVNKAAVSNTNIDSKSVGPIKLDGVAFASLLKGTAAADFNANTCVIGKPISQGEGTAADAQLVGTGGAANAPFTNPLIATDSTGTTPAVNDSQSAEFISPPLDASGKPIAAPGLGLTSETTQIIAPVTLFKGTVTELTIQIAGVFRLQAEAGGVPGSARVVFAPVGNVSPSAPVVTILTRPVPGGPQLKVAEVTLQQLLGGQGLTIPVPGIATLSVGALPHAIGGTGPPQVAADGTSASGAVDIVKLTLLDGTVADLRIGHFESRASVPAGGISCPIPVSKVANPTTVAAGNDFTYTITVANPYDCTLTDVRLTDTISAESGVKFTVKSTAPGATVSGGTITFNDIGPIGPHSSKQATITVNIPPDSGPGKLTDKVTATANCGGGSTTGGTRVTIPTSSLTGSTTIISPTVGAPANRGNNNRPSTGGGGELANTGSTPTLPIAATLVLGAALGAFALRRRRAS